jgi:putative oligomerization/nucleic acid binding protein
MGLLRGVARTAVVAGTATAVSNRVSRRQARRWQQDDYEQAAQYDRPAPAGGGAGEGLTAELERLSQLRSNGIITDDEFTAAKAKLLNQ